MPERSVTGDWRREYREGEVVIRALGWRVRFYAGHSYVDRPRVHAWAGYGHRGIVLRRRRGVARRPVLGVQWRRLDG